MSSVIIGYDNTDNEMHPIILNEYGGFIVCEAYDWAYDVTSEQVEQIKTGNALSVVEELTSPAELDWFVLRVEMDFITTSW